MLTENPETQEDLQQDRPIPSRLIRWILLGVVLAFLSSAFLLHIPWVQQQIIGVFSKKLEKTVGLHIQLESYWWMPFSRITLNSLKVYSGDKEFLLCDRAELTYQFAVKWPYLIPEILFLDRPTLYLEKDGSGRWSIPWSQRSSTPRWISQDKGIHLKVFPWPELRIKSGRIRGLQQGHVFLSVQNVDGTLSFRTSPGDTVPSLILDFGQWQG